MPAKDSYHDLVIRALEKAGWKIDRDQYPIRVGFKRVWIDLKIERSSAEPVFIEIQDFVELSVESLRDAIGQYILYRAALRHTGFEASALYLAMTERAYSDLFDIPLGQLVTDEVALNVLIFDPVSEEIVQWLPYQKPFAES